MGKQVKINYNNTFATTHSRDYYRGASFHWSGKWLVGAHYISDDYNVDFVVHDQVLLACAKSHLSTLDNEPKEYIRDEKGTVVGVVSTYWDFVLSGIVGKSPGIKIIDNYWYICEDTGVPEEEQVWTNTGVKAKMELEDLTPEEIEILQRPGIEVVTDFVNNTITQELGQNTDKIMSQKAVTDNLNTKATNSALSAAITNEVLRANNAYQPKGDYVINSDFQECCTTVNEHLGTHDTQIETNATAISTETGTRESEISRLEDQIKALALGAKLTIGVSPNCVYKESPTNVTITATVNGVTPTSITISDTEVIATGITSPLTTSKQYRITSNVALSATATYGSMTFNASTTLNARYPITYGFGATWGSVWSSGNKLSARTSAAGNYPKVISPADNQHFYIVYRDDIPVLNNFTMGGAPYVMNYQLITVAGNNYRVYESGATYNTGAEVTVTAN